MCPTTGFDLAQVDSCLQVNARLGLRCTPPESLRSSPFLLGEFSYRPDHFGFILIVVTRVVFFPPLCNANKKAGEIGAIAVGIIAFWHLIIFMLSTPTLIFYVARQAESNLSSIFFSKYLNAPRASPGVFQMPSYLKRHI